jgi:hypothetical protein
MLRREAMKRSAAPGRPPPGRSNGRSIKEIHGAVLATPFFSSAQAQAQSQNTYGLTEIKPYNGVVVAKPAANSLQRVISAERPPNGSNKPIGDPVFTIHAAGGVVIDSTIRR